MRLFFDLFLVGVVLLALYLLITGTPVYPVG